MYDRFFMIPWDKYPIDAPEEHAEVHNVILLVPIFVGTRFFLMTLKVFFLPLRLD